MAVSANAYGLQSIERPPKLSELIETQLRDAIAKNVFREEEALPSENELAKLFGVSRNVIREALLTLDIKGILEVRKGKGAFVVKPSINDVLDPFSRLVNYKCGNEGLKHILAVRQMIEPTVAVLAAAQRTDEDIARLQENLKMMETFKSDKVKISHYDIDFHNTVSWAAKNPLIPIVLEPIFHVLYKFHPPIFYDPQIAETTVEYHRRIFRAIEQRDGNAAREAMAAHLKVAEEHNLRLYENKMAIAS